MVDYTSTNTGTGIDAAVDRVQAVSGDLIGSSDTQTLTNKTINADNNTISNLAIGSEVSASLGANLVLNSNDITGTGNINITGTLDTTGDINLTKTGAAATLKVDADVSNQAVLRLDSGVNPVQHFMESGVNKWAEFYDTTNNEFNIYNNVLNEQCLVLKDDSDVEIPSGGLSIGVTDGLRELDVAGDIVQNDGTNAWLWNLNGGNLELWYQTTYSGGDAGWTQLAEFFKDGTGIDFKDDVDLSAGNLSVSAGNITAQSGDISGGIFTESHATSHTLTNTECFGAVYYVTGAATLTLPAIEDGMSLTVITIGAVAVSVDPNASDKIWLDGTALDDGDKITNTSTAGDIAVLTYYSADGWHASTNGWTDGGA